MVALFHDIMHKKVEVYFDDIISKSKEGGSPIAVLRKLFERLRKYQMKLNPEKCTFGPSSGNMLGFVAGREGIRVDSKKVEAIQEMPAPKAEKEVRSFLGRLNYIARFIANLTSTCLFGKSAYLGTAKTGPTVDFIYDGVTNFNGCNVGAIWRNRKDLLRSSVGIQKAPVIQKSFKGGEIPDQCVESPIHGEDRLLNEFPDSGVYVIDELEKDVWEMYFDEVVNMHGSGVGAVIISLVDKQYLVAVKLDFECTNNIVEYKACINGLLFAYEMNVKMLRVFGHSTLIIYQVNGKWQTKDTKLIPYQKYLSSLAEKFKEICFSHVTRNKNQFADALATLAVMTKLEVHASVCPIQVMTQDEPSYCCANLQDDDEPWYHDIKRYIQHKEYPEGASDVNKKTIHRLAGTFFLNGEVLYKRSHDGMLFRCVDIREIQLFMTEIHEGICGTQANGHMMAKKILRSGYYWTTMEANFMGYV
ncbi:PREDICTED: uncharacterized protein LOC109327701 [Lupinus angustifolius]|uniref:uncharacterized protein LOC109327701 n=1 Tax=Lupinus angustifolius TaxID=3871 RepID=UPI00092F4FCB|nr:PREDICTED: uncharacterized protein LOC109327701 [Lupinus angustifolius]